jgi:hypothetical protein
VIVVPVVQFTDAERTANPAPWTVSVPGTVVDREIRRVAKIERTQRA